MYGRAGNDAAYGTAVDFKSLPEDVGNVRLVVEFELKRSRNPSGRRRTKVTRDEEVAFRKPSFGRQLSSGHI